LSREPGKSPQSDRYHLVRRVAGLTAGHTRSSAFIVWAKRQQLSPCERVGLGLADRCGDRVCLVLVEAARGDCKVVFEVRA
jgi:hypothetical protein